MYNGQNFNVSVVIPTKNGYSNGIGKLLDSLEKQRNVLLQIIAVDSGSNDSTREYLTKRGVEVYSIAEREFSHSYSRNFGAKHARFDFIFFCVDDCVIGDANFICNNIQELITNNFAAISSFQDKSQASSSYAQYLAIIYNRIRLPYRGYIVKMSPSFLVDFKKDLYPNYLDSTNLLIKSNIFKEVCFSGISNEDIALSKSLLHHGYSYGINYKNSIVHYHEYDASRLRRYLRNLAIDINTNGSKSPLFRVLQSKRSNVFQLYGLYNLRVRRALKINKRYGSSKALIALEIVSALVIPFMFFTKVNLIDRLIISIFFILFWIRALFFSFQINIEGQAELKLFLRYLTNVSKYNLLYKLNNFLNVDKSYIDDLHEVSRW